MLHYKSTLYETLETLVRLPALLLGTDEQKQMVIVEFFNNYVENPVQQQSRLLFLKYVTHLNKSSQTSTKQIFHNCCFCERNIQIKQF